MSPGERPPVATWYNKGWKTWWLRRSISVTSTASRPRCLAASNPPNPPPMMTTPCGETMGIPNQLDAGGVDSVHFQELTDVRVVRLLQLANGSLEDHPAIVEYHNPVRNVPHQVKIVGDYHGG